MIIKLNDQNLAIPKQINKKIHPHKVILQKLIFLFLTKNIFRNHVILGNIIISIVGITAWFGSVTAIICYYLILFCYLYKTYF